MEVFLSVPYPDLEEQEDNVRVKKFETKIEVLNTGATRFIQEIDYFTIPHIVCRIDGWRFGPFSLKLKHTKAVFDEEIIIGNNVKTYGNEYRKALLSSIFSETVGEFTVYYAFEEILLKIGLKDFEMRKYITHFLIPSKLKELIDNYLKTHPDLSFLLKYAKKCIKLPKSNKYVILKKLHIDSKGWYVNDQLIKEYISTLDFLLSIAKSPDDYVNTLRELYKKAKDSKETKLEEDKT